MKKFMRLAMVLALAGATLLYSGCTKDYQKDIDDLNTDVTTLKNTVQALQNQVSALEELRSKVSELEKADKDLKTLIDACNAEIKKIQDGYATKDELESGLAALKNEITETLNGLAADVKDNTEAIAALQEAYEAVGDFTEALNSDKIASVVLVPSMKFTDKSMTIYEPAVNFNLTNSKRGSTAEPLFTTERMVDLHFAVRPASLAASFNNDNTVLNVVVRGLGEISYPVTIYDADPETGDVYLVSQIACPASKYKDLFEKETIYPFSLEVSDITEGGVYNSIQSPFGFAYAVGAMSLGYFFYDEAEGEIVEDKLSDILVPWNEYATSERSFFEGYAVGLGSPLGYYTLDEAAYIFGVDVADITPELHISDVKYSRNPKGSDNIAVDSDAWTAAMTSTKAAEAKAAVGAFATATIEAYFNQDFVKYPVVKAVQTYEVTAAEGKTITIADYNFHWVGEDKTPANHQALNLTVSDKIPDNLDLKAYDANGNVIATATANVDGELVNVTFTSQIAFKDKAQTIKFVGYPYIKDQETYDTVVFNVTLDPKPANKKLDLGVFTIDGSATKNIPVSLDGIVKALVNGDEDLYANFAKSPLYQTIATNFNENKTITKVGVELADGTVRKYENYGLGHVFGSFALTYWDKDAADGSHKAGDASTLTMYRPIYGATYTFFGSTKAYGVNYEFTFQVVVNSADFALETTPNVSAGNVINVFAEITGSTIFDRKYTINDVYFSDYFQISKVVSDELYVNFVFDYEYKDADKGIYYAGNALWGTSKEIVPTGWSKNNIVRVNEASKTLVREGNFLNWNNYEGRQIYGTATLGYFDGIEFVPVGDAIEFTLVTPDPIKTFEVAPITTDERVAGKAITVDLSSSLALTSQIDGVTIKPSWKFGDQNVHYWSYYDLSFGYFDAETSKVAALPEKLEGTLNGQPFTFVKGTHYTVDGSEITFLANNAYGDITFSVPVGIEHVYGYGVAEHSANLEVAIPQHKQ